MGVCTLLLFTVFHSCRLHYSMCVCNFIYIQTKLLQCYSREIVNIQTRLRDVQGPGDDDLGPPVSLLGWTTPSTRSQC